MRFLPRSQRHQRGSVILTVAFSLIGLLSFCVLAIDVSVLMTTKTQLQNAADAAALAGALELSAAGSQPDAIDAAIGLAAANLAYVSTGPYVNQRQSVQITPADITFPNPGEVAVTTHRTRATGDPLGTYFLRVANPFSDGFSEVTATAVAGWDPLCGANCLKPFTPPDRWYDANGDGIYNPDPETNPDEFYDPAITGYNAATDNGTLITIKGGDGDDNGFLNSHYFPVRYPPVNKGNPVSGANAYREWISDCFDETLVIEPGDVLETQPGFMNGPTRQGITNLINEDPDAFWDAGSGSVVSSWGRSPRVVLLPIFDPAIGPQLSGNGRNHLVVVKVAALFVESFDPASNAITGRFLRTTAMQGTRCSGPGASGFINGVRLIQ
jgi:Flp pilus assembly protein TadG